MRAEHDGMRIVRADLCERLETLQQAAGTIEMRDLAKRLAAIRILAGAYGLAPVATLAEAFERAVRAEPRFCPAGLYFERLRDAVGCERADPAASEAMLASVAVRIG